MFQVCKQENAQKLIIEGKKPSPLPKHHPTDHAKKLATAALVVKTKSPLNKESTPKQKQKKLTNRMEKLHTTKKVGFGSPTKPSFLQTNFQVQSNRPFNLPWTPFWFTPKFHTAILSVT